MPADIYLNPKSPLQTADLHNNDYSDTDDRQFYQQPLDSKQSLALSSDAEQSRASLLIPSTHGDFLVPLGKPYNYDKKTAPKTALNENILIEHLVGLRIQTLPGDLHNPASIVRLPKWLREKIYLSRIRHYTQVTTSETKNGPLPSWLSLLNRYEEHLVEQALLPTSATLESGWVYLFRDGYLWREFKVDPLHGGEQVLYREVNLETYLGKNERAAEGAPSESLLTHVQTMGSPHHLQYAYSLTQWSWARIEALGGMDANDIRILKNYTQLAPYKNIDKSQADNLRQARMGAPIDFSLYANHAIPTSELAKSLNEITSEQLMLRPDNIPTLFLSNPLIQATRLQQDIYFLRQQLINTVSALQYQAAAQGLRVPKGLTEFLQENSEFAWQDFTPGAALQTAYCEWLQEQQNKPNSPPLGNRLHTALLSYQLCFNPVYNALRKVIHIENDVLITGNHQSQQTTHEDQEGNEFYDLGQRYLSEDLLKTTLEVQRRAFIRDEIRRLQHELIALLEQDKDGTASNSVSLQACLMDAFAVPQEQTGKGYLLLAGLLSHTTHDARTIDHWLDIGQITEEETDTITYLKAALQLPAYVASQQTVMRRKLPPQTLPTPPGIPFLTRLLQAKQGDKIYPLKQALFPTGGSDDPLRSESQGIFSDTRWKKAWEIQRGQAAPFIECPSHYLAEAMTAWAQLLLPVWTAPLQSALSKAGDYNAALQQATALQQPFIDLLRLSGEKSFEQLQRSQNGTLPQDNAALSEAFLQRIKKDRGVAANSATNQQGLTPEEDSGIEYVEISQDNQGNTVLCATQEKPAPTRPIDANTALDLTKGTLQISTAAFKHIDARAYCKLQGLIAMLCIGDAYQSTLNTLANHRGLTRWMDTLTDVMDAYEAAQDYRAAKMSLNQAKTLVQENALDDYLLQDKYSIAKFTTLEVMGLVTAGYGIVTSVQTLIAGIKNHDPAQAWSGGLAALAAGGGLGMKLVETDKKMSNEIVEKEISEQIDKKMTTETVENIFMKTAEEIIFAECIPGINIILDILVLSSIVIGLFRKTPLESWADACWFSERQHVFEAWKKNPTDEYVALLSLLIKPYIKIKGGKDSGLVVTCLFGENELLKGASYEEQVTWCWSAMITPSLAIASAITPGVVCSPPIQITSLSHAQLIDVKTGKIVGIRHQYPPLTPEQQKAGIQPLVSYNSPSIELHAFVRYRFHIGDVQLPLIIDVPWKQDTEDNPLIDYSTDFTQSKNWFYANDWNIEVTPYGVSDIMRIEK